MDTDLTKNLAEFPLKFIPFLFALCFHEFAHGWVARRKGDMTASVMGRLTMNPLAHADLLGTFILPAAGLIFGMPIFGWAKPVPVNPRNLKRPLQDMFWISAAGPASNLLLAMIAVFAYVGIETHAGGMNAAIPRDSLISMLIFFVQINVILAVFNLIPLHPLDGAKIIARFLPPDVNQKLEDNQMMTSFVLLALVMTGVLFKVLGPVTMVILNAMVFLADKVWS